MADRELDRSLIFEFMKGSIEDLEKYALVGMSPANPEKGWRVMYFYDIGVADSIATVESDNNRMVSPRHWLTKEHKRYLRQYLREEKQKEKESQSMPKKAPPKRRKSRTETKASTKTKKVINKKISKQDLLEF